MHSGTSFVRPTLPEFFLLILATSIPAATTVVLFSDISPLGVQVYDFLGELHVLSTLGSYAAAGMCFLLISYVLDVQQPQKSPPWNHIAVAFLVVGGVCIIASLFCLTYWSPSVPVIIGACFTLLPVLLLRKTTFEHASSQDYSFQVYLVFATLSVIIALTWTIWAFSPALGQAHPPWKTEVGENSANIPILGNYVLWLSPIILAILYACIALLAALRSQIHLPENPEEPMDEKTANFVKRELRVALLCIVVMLLIMWIAASTTVEGTIGLSKTVDRVGAAILGGVTIYMFHTFGMDRVAKAARSSAAVKYSLEICQSDWVIGLALLVTLPFLPLYFLIEALHHQVRRFVTGNVGDFDESESEHFSGKEKHFLSHEARALITWAETQSWTSIITKTIYLSMLVFFLQILFGQGINVFLVWLDERMMNWPLLLIMSMLFAVGLFLFLLPPVPGAPIYLIAGTVITQKCSQNGVSFSMALLISVTFSYILKLASIAIQQKGIGGPLSSNVTVKRLVGIHTPPMKAIRHILSQKGLRPSKVAVLIGGPDWPVSVLTGIMGLPVSEMLLGSTPILFVVAPFVLTSAYATVAHDADHIAEREMLLYYSNMFLALSSFMLIAVMAFAFYFIQQALEDHEKGQEFETDPQEHLILEQEKEAKEEAEAIQQQTAWGVLPTWLHCMLVMGVVLASALTLILMCPLPVSKRPFLPFSTSNAMSDLPGGTPLGLVQPLGWFCVGLLAACSGIMAIFQAWCALFANRVNETTPLLRHHT